ncbi:MAG: cytochrome c [Chitinophagales bacterium]
MKKPVNPLIEFGLVILLIAAAIFAALNINFKWPSSSTSTKKTETTAAASRTPEEQKWYDGKSYFKSECAACHNPKADGTGPALMGVEKRWEAAGSYNGKSGKQWLYSWIKNWNDPVNAGYKYAVDMANSRIAAMNTFSSLSDEKIDAILFYLNEPDKYAGKAMP